MTRYNQHREIVYPWRKQVLVSVRTAFTFNFICYSVYFTVTLWWRGKGGKGESGEKLINSAFNYPVSRPAGQVETA